MTTNTQPQTQQSGGDEPIFDEIELLIGSALLLVRREATKQWLMEVIQPGDEHWHMHDMTSSVMGIKQLIQAREREAEQRVIEWLESDLKRLDSRNWTMETLALDTIVGSGKADEYQKMKRQQIVVDRRAAHALYAILSNYKNRPKPQAGEGGEG